MDSRIWLLTGLFAIGCVRNVYNVELVADGRQVERTLTVKRYSNQAATEVEEDVEWIAQAYGMDVPVADEEQTFRGEFTGKLPNDIGNFGVYESWETPLGSATVYGERIRGDIDAADELKQIEAAANRIVELLIEWLDQELEEDEHWPRLQTFLDTQVRRDLYNVSVYIWASPIAEKSDETRLQARILLYLAEKGYFTVDEIPEILRSLSSEDVEQIYAFCKGWLVERLHGDPDWWPELNPEDLMQSLDQFLKTTEEYTDLQNTAIKANQDLDEIDGDSVIAALAAKLIGASSIIGDYDKLKLSLKTPGIAIFTNGEQAANGSELHWSVRLPSPGQIPVLAYAVIAKPNEATQERYFGKTALSGESLLQYCLWYHGLTEEERREWDAFIAQRRPGPDLRKELKTFRFSSESENLPLEDRLANPVIEAIRDALRD